MKSFRKYEKIRIKIDNALQAKLNPGSTNYLCTTFVNADKNGQLIENFIQYTVKINTSHSNLSERLAITEKCNADILLQYNNRSV
jgi:hypothetical protein